MSSPNNSSSLNFGFFSVKHQKSLPLIINKSKSFRIKFSATPNSVQASPIFSSKTIKHRSITRENVHNMIEEPPERLLSKGSMEFYPGPLGAQARLEFFESYKNIRNQSERTQFENLEENPNLAYLEKIDKGRLSPNPFGIIRRKGPEAAIDINHYSMGDHYARAFSRGLNHYRDLERLDLGSNRLTESGSVKILKNLQDKNVKKLSLADNAIGIKSIAKIIELTSRQNSKLKHINLEKTKLGDHAAIELCKHLTENKTVTKLNLACNNLSSKSASAIKEMIRYNTCIKCLDFHWNSLRWTGALEIFEGLYQNDCIKQLDLSWNAMGRYENLDVAQAISKALRINTVLRHLDLSHNNFKEEECKTIGEGLSENHDLLGIHMLGNDCYIDSKGFIIPTAYSGKLEQGHFFHRILESKKNKPPQKGITMNCWVCEKWVEMAFIWVPGRSGEAKTEPIFLHLECDNYEPQLMDKLPNNSYQLSRAVPPGLIRFFYSDLNGPMKSDDFKIKYLDQPFKSKLHYGEGYTEAVNIHAVNIRTVSGEVYGVNDSFNVKPRTLGRVYQPPVEELERIPWNIPISLFKDYKFDSEEILNECFEFDWRYSRLANFVKNPADQEAVKDILKKCYIYIKETYRNLSAYGGSELFSIGTNVLTDFLNQCQLIDNFYGASDMGVNWNSAIVPKEKGQIYNPGSALVRYEFMEILVRIANDRFLRNKICTNIADSVQKIFKDNFLRNMTQMDTNIWRDQKYLCEEVDLVLKAHKPILDAIYKKYSGKKTLPGQRVFMCLDEFRSLCTEGGLVNDNFASREIDLCFNLAMMTQVDELYKKRHIEMSFVEFLEALCRAFDMSSIVNVELIELEEEKHLFDSNNQNLPLHTKVEAGIQSLIRLCPDAVRSSFVYPTEETYKKMMYRPKSKADN
ncbi:unnamed protein product [Blepharisma stoltei]|uniref:Uncharacterized protein n=1 Tax=Blepharisma stoltei TaxID=1481888 RepID=A0AAU9JI51_9CILI|nr:unnamed protein product [Blepharisma stoltei]